MNVRVMQWHLAPPIDAAPIAHFTADMAVLKQLLIQSGAPELFHAEILNHVRGTVEKSRSNGPAN